jgi:hypothetical protein
MSLGMVGRKVIERGYLFVQMIFVNVVQIVVHEYRRQPAFERRINAAQAVFAFVAGVQRN